jgi:hypothetical protein
VLSRPGALLSATASERVVKRRKSSSTARGCLSRLGRIDVLVIDDSAMAPLSETERRDFWEISEDRYQARSTRCNKLRFAPVRRRMLLLETTVGPAARERGPR